MLQPSQYYYGLLKLTHLPTGESVLHEWKYRESWHSAREKAMCRLVGKLKVLPASTEEVASYEFPDDQPYPDDITLFKIAS